MRHCIHYIPGSEISGRHVTKCDSILYKATQTAEVVAISGDLASLCAAVHAVGNPVCCCAWSVARSAARKSAGAGQIGGGRGKVH